MMSQNIFKRFCMPQTQNTFSKKVSWILLALIVLLAFAARSYNIENIPSGVYPDEATNATDALRALETGDFKLFYENNYGREGLFINLQALALKTLGTSVFALKLWSILFGTLTVLGMYLLAKELWQKRFVALGAAYLTAVSFWAINFSRIGFRAIMVPFLLTFTFYFFFHGLRTKSIVSFLLAGLTFGLGLHTYIAFRVAPLILVIFLTGLILSYKGFLKMYWKHGFAFVLGALISAAPMFWDFYQHPDHFISRSSAISVFSPEVNGGNLPSTLIKTIGLSLAKYNFWGDQNWRHNYPPYPVLDPFSGLLFLAGFLYLIPRTVRLLIRRFKDQDRNRELAINFLFLGWFFAMLMPEFLTNEGLPHALRAIGTIPVVFLIAATPLLWIGEKIKGLQWGMKLATTSILMFVFLGTGLFNLTKYFVFFAHNPHQHGAFNENYKHMARYLKELPAETHKYVLANAGGKMIDNGLPVTAQSLTFLTHGRVENLEFLQPETALQTPAVIVLMSYDSYIIDRVTQFFPEAREEKIDYTPGYGSDFTAIVIP
jgi:4-amino-4-deoxy-L-arabinose transferase-like glycosyltransferase